MMFSDGDDAPDTDNPAQGDAGWGVLADQHRHASRGASAPDR